MNPNHRLPAIRQLIRRHQTGVTMIEALVTLAIVSFGLLGAGGLMLRGITGTNVANMRSIATMQANEIIDRMRANTVGVRDGNFGSFDTYSAPGSCATTCETASCTAADMSTYDVCRWNQRNAALLPQGRGVIQQTRDAPGQHTFDIAVCWNEDKDSDTNCSLADDASSGDLQRLVIRGARP
jgi:type IV pilus assembly protein PilV